MCYAVCTVLPVCVLCVCATRQDARFPKASTPKIIHSEAKQRPNTVEGEKSPKPTVEKVMIASFATVFHSIQLISWRFRLASYCGASFRRTGVTQTARDAM